MNEEEAVKRIAAKGLTEKEEALLKSLSVSGRIGQADELSRGQLVHELTEALLEIKRHHADFQKIRTILDRIELGHPLGEDVQLAKEIRNIVG
ncbi:MAG TPA: hypothetical protein VJ742_13445 [Nitrososphaera sp.]|nr:hypothetical protein [Nitrososphaera sp.]